MKAGIILMCSWPDEFGVWRSCSVQCRTIGKKTFRAMLSKRDVGCCMRE